MESPCQKIVWDVLPAIRAAIAVELVKCGVSQYLSGKRGYRIEFENDVKKSIEHLAKDLKDEKKINLIQRICTICKQLRENEEGCGDSKSSQCG